MACCKRVKPMSDVYNAEIVRDPQVNGGEPTLRGTRVTVRTVLASLAEGAWIDHILADFPTINEAQVRAVIAFAAASTSAPCESPRRGG